MLTKQIMLKRTWLSGSKLLFVSISGLILPSLLVPSLPNSWEPGIISEMGLIAHAQDSSATTEKKVYKIGVIAKRGKDKAMEQWQPHAEYLSSAIPEADFEMVPLSFEEIIQGTANKELDFLITNPGMYVLLEADYGINRLVSLKNLRLGKPYIEFGAVILTKADRDDINTLKDFKGKTFMGVEENSFGGWQMAWDVFLDNKINPQRHFKSLTFSGTHDKVVMAVLNGEVDGGTIRTDTLERMAAEGKIDLQDLKIINQQQDTTGTFPFIHSTPLYPEWAFSATKGIPLDLEEQVAKILLNISPDSEVAKAAKMEGWTVPLSYRSVHELFIDLKIAPYDELGQLTLAQLLQRMWIFIVLALLALAGITIYFQKRSLAEQKMSEKALSEVNKSLEKSAQEQRQQKEQQQKEKEELEAAIYTLIDEVSDATEGDLTVRANLDSMEMSTVADIFNAIIDNLQEIALEAKQSTNQVGSALKENESAIRLLAEQAITEAQETRNTLTSVEQMSHSIKKIANSASQAEKIADDTYNTIVHSTDNMDLTVDSILNLRTTVGETSQKMKHLRESSAKISEVVSLIEEIALKTNVLAINTTSEADRAGEYGRGFTIIAEQVGALAKQCTAATKEIATIVAGIQRETQEVNQAMEAGTTQVIESTHLVESTKKSLGLVLEKSQKINQLMGSISQTTISQANTSQEVTNLMQKIAQLSETTSQSSKEVAQSIFETAQVAQNLESTVAKFKVTSDSK